MNTEDWQGGRYLRWQAAAERPLLVLSLLLIPVLVWPFADKHLSIHLRHLDDGIDYAIWAIFVVDYVVRLWLAQRRLTFVRRNVPDLLLVALPMLRPLRAARLLRLLRLTRLAAALRLVTKSQERSIHARAVTYVATIAGAATLLAALGMNEIETGRPGANIRGFGDSVWWAFTTVSTVGYGDRYPVTAGGRVIAGCLMIVGVSLFGVITASVAAYFVRHVKQLDSDTTEQEMSDKIDRLESLILQLLSAQDIALPNASSTGDLGTLPS